MSIEIEEDDQTKLCDGETLVYTWIRSNAVGTGMKMMCEPKTVCPLILSIDSVLSKRDAEIDALTHLHTEMLSKYQGLVRFFDKQVGTPCEQVRHQQESDALHEKLAAANMILKSLGQKEVT